MYVAKNIKANIIPGEAEDKGPRDDSTLKPKQVEDHALTINCAAGSGRRRSLGGGGGSSSGTPSRIHDGDMVAVKLKDSSCVTQSAHGLPPESSDGAFSARGGKSQRDNTWFGIEIKSQYGFNQWLVIPMLTCAMMNVGVYFNTQVTYMLQDSSMFGQQKDRIGKFTSDITAWSLVFSMPATFCMGYFYEIIGRKLTLFISFFTTAFIFYCIPMTAPSYFMLVASRCAIGITMAAPISHPLVSDYVQKKSRGKAVALSNMGVIVGEVTTVGILFNFTKSMSYENAFSIVSVVILLFSFYFLWAIEDPNFKVLQRNVDRREDQIQPEDLETPDGFRALEHLEVNRMITDTPKKPADEFEQMGCLSKAVKLTSLVGAQMREKPVIFICIVGAAIIRLFAVLFSTYLLLWIQSYAYNGVLETIDQSKTIYMQIMMISVAISALLFPVVGSLFDIYSPCRIVPMAFLLRFLTTWMFYMLERPDTILAYGVCVLMIIATIIEAISIDSVFNKSLPKATRGLLNSAYSLVGQFGILIYSYVSGIMFDSLGPKSPFILIGAADFFFAVAYLYYGFHKQFTY